MNWIEWMSFVAILLWCFVFVFRQIEEFLRLNCRLRGFQVERSAHSLLRRSGGHQFNLFDSVYRVPGKGGRWKWVFSLPQKIGSIGELVADNMFAFVSSACDDDEYDCEDATCISSDLRCNGRINCRFRWDEDECQVIDLNKCSVHFLQNRRRDYIAK